jgi:hypothetical protein
VTYPNPALLPYVTAKDVTFPNPALLPYVTAKGVTYPNPAELRQTIVNKDLQSSKLVF